jgi:hypothetical protein
MSSHLRFEEIKTDKKTYTFAVISNFDDTNLGVIQFYPGWRSYMLEPAFGCLWSWYCLKECSEFIKKQNDTWKFYQKLNKKEVGQ